MTRSGEPSSSLRPSTLWFNCVLRVRHQLVDRRVGRTRARRVTQIRISSPEVVVMPSWALRPSELDTVRKPGYSNE